MTKNCSPLSGWEEGQLRVFWEHREEAPAQPEESGKEVPSQLGPEEQELLARPRQGKDNSKLRGKRKDSTFEKRQVYVQNGGGIDLRAQC